MVACICRDWSIPAQGQYITIPRVAAGAVDAVVAELWRAVAAIRPWLRGGGGGQGRQGCGERKQKLHHYFARHFG